MREREDGRVVVGDLVTVWLRLIFALVVVVVEVRVAEVSDLALQAAGYEDVVEGLQLALEGEAVAFLGRRMAPACLALTNTPPR